MGSCFHGAWDYYLLEHNLGNVGLNEWASGLSDNSLSLKLRTNLYLRHYSMVPSVNEFFKGLKMMKNWGKIVLVPKGKKYNKKTAKI